jgi:phosphoenolpyruvate---glycerone phosphotransferase subunit DhaK
MKKLINVVENVLYEQLEGMALAHPQLIAVHFDPHYIVRRQRPMRGKVALVSGGGSGHEPMHGGFVGHGMLDGACPGAIFTSPTPDQILACAQAAHGGEGVLLIVKNYTGDVMSFEVAAELLHVEGIRVRTVLVDDDVAVKDSLYTAGRRGVAATVILEKIAGGAAEAGYSLDELAELARRVNTNSRSMGLALSSCTVPAVGKPTFDLGENEIEIGIGIHGEPGQKRITLVTLDEMTAMLAGEILDDKVYQRSEREWDPQAGDWRERTLVNLPFERGDRVIALVNSMGGTPISELYAAYRSLVRLCEGRDIHIVRNLIGPYVTSLEMAGCSITLTRVDDELLRFWDAPVHTPALRWEM